MNTTTQTVDQWVTRADMGALAKRSEDVIRRDEQKHELETRKDEAGRVQVKVADFVRIGRITEADLALPGGSGNAAESAEVLRARTTISDLQVKLARTEGLLASANAHHDEQRQQIEVKDKQLKARADEAATFAQTIARLTAIIASAGGAA